MTPDLRVKLLLAAGAGALAISGVLTKHFEGTRYTPYRDPAGIWTVCEGITGPDVILNKTYTPAECDTLGVKHRKIAEQRAKAALIYWDSYGEWTQAALIDFVFNLGPASVHNTRIARLLNAGDLEGGCRELNRWVKARVKGELVTLNGLVTRRGAESEICVWE